MSEFIEVKESGIHGTGVYAIKDIPKGAKVVQYIGEKITKDESSRRENERIHKTKNGSEARTYIFELNDDFDIDGIDLGNDAKFINHSCDPNCEVDIENDEIWVYALKDIKKGEELTYNYGFDLTPDYEHHPCHCASENCVGYIVAEDQWPELKNHKILKEMEHKG